MRLLIITQKVDENDDNLGFFHNWLYKFANKCQRVVVICLEKGGYHLPENVKVLSLGKEEYFRQPRVVRRLVAVARFFKYIWRERKNYDAVFVHMNPEYVVLAGLFWKILGKKIGLWYVHKSINLALRLAEKFTDKIFTASEESFRLKSDSDKVVITGHGIDIEKFSDKIRKQRTKIKIITVGRIAPVKNLHILIEAADILANRKNFRNFEIKIIGVPILKSDKKYFKQLEESVKERRLGGFVGFLGAIPHKEIGEIYKEADIFVHLSGTGSMDKAVLEAMASGLPVLSSSEAFKNILPEEFIISQNSPAVLADAILNFKRPFEATLNALKNLVSEKHGLEDTIDKIITNLNE